MFLDDLKTFWCSDVESISGNKTESVGIGKVNFKWVKLFINHRRDLTVAIWFAFDHLRMSHKDGIDIVVRHVVVWAIHTPPHHSNDRFRTWEHSFLINSDCPSSREFWVQVIKLPIKVLIKIKSWVHGPLLHELLVACKSLWADHYVGPVEVWAGWVDVAL